MTHSSGEMNGSGNQVNIPNCLFCLTFNQRQKDKSAAARIHGQLHSDLLTNTHARNVPSVLNNLNHSHSQTVDNKDQVAICLQRDSLDRITASEVSDLHHSPTTNSTSHNAELQDVFPAAFFTAPGTFR